MSYNTEPVTMWFDRRIVMRQSPIQGIGTFASEAIAAGETLVWVTGGVVFTSADWQSGAVQLAGEMYNEEKLAEDLFIATPKAFHYYINHSCDANAVDQSRRPNWTHYIACRDIRAGEEITTDYGLYGGANFETCACKSPRCRGRITPEDRFDPEMRRRFGAYFHFDPSQEPTTPLPPEVTK